MKKDIIFYAFSTALNKGATLLFFPILTQMLTLKDFGIWSLVMVVSNLLIPLLSLNGAAGILREGSTEIENGLYLLKKYIQLSMLIGIVSSISIFYIFSDNWFFYSVLIALAETLLLLGLTYLRTMEESFMYFIISLLKTIAILLVILYAKENSISLNLLLQYHFFVVIVMALSLMIFLTVKYHSKVLKLTPVLFFSIALIPHSLSQWIMSSSDRIILEQMLGSTSVGIYSLAYNIALVLMLVNSGIALALPTYMIKNFKNWKDEKYDTKLIKYYTAISIILFFFVFSLYYIDLKYSHILGYYGDEMPILILVIYLSIYILGLYYFYANYLFYYKKAAIISKVTFKAALLNVLLTAIFIYFIGVLGAAVATFIAYVYYLILIKNEVLKIDKDIDIKLFKIVTIFFIVCLGIFIFFRSIS
jgi:O-antigen/teichoic acid export membrane protein